MTAKKGTTTRTPQTRTVKGPGGDDMELIKWFPTPMWVPTEVLEELKREAGKRGMSLAEYVLMCAMYGADYTKESVTATRRLCFNSTVASKEKDNA